MLLIHLIDNFVCLCEIAFPHYGDAVFSFSSKQLRVTLADRAI